jgi:short-subunit dehydrogenase
MSTNEAALVTGGGSGMGQALVWRLASQGRKVAIIDLNETGMAETAARYPELIKTYASNVSDAGAVGEVVSDVEKELGPIGYVATAAGIVRVGKLAEQDVSDTMLTMAVNFGGVVNVCQQTVPAMLKRGHGEVVNFASLNGWLPGQKLGAYSASKFAVVSYTETLWTETRGTGLKVVCVCPPAVATPMLHSFHPQEKNVVKVQKMAITSDQVIDDIEKCLQRDRLWVLPGLSKVMVPMRRHFPNLVRKATGMKRFVDLLG